MARPKVPLISKREVVRTALEIVDAEGMEALSIRRIGAELNVNGASLYHHFADKDEILEAVGRAVLSEMTIPKVGDDPIQWIIDVSKSQRRVMLKHPEVIPLLSRGYLRHQGLAAYQTTRQLLADLGVSEQGQVIVMESVEAFCVGTVLVTIMSHSTPPASNGKDGTPRRKVLSTNAGTRDEKNFETTLRVLIEDAISRYSVN